MYPEILRIPYFNWPLHSYGLMMMLGFLFAIWFAMRRAAKVQADPDLILNAGFVSLIFGVLGGRLFYVLHYWKSDFAILPNPILAAVDLTAGGLEFYGGLIGATLAVFVYFRFFARFHVPGDDLKKRGSARPSLRLYLDISGPGVMIGLAFGRIGCFLNGCCWGGICTVEHDHRQTAAVPWAVTFPYASPPFIRQWENRQLTVPAELIFDSALNVNAPYLLSAESLRTSPAEFEQIKDELSSQFRQVREKHSKAKAEDPNSPVVKALVSQLRELKGRIDEFNAKHGTVVANMEYPSRKDPSKKMNRDELRALSKQYRSLPVHPVQLYDTINAFLLYGLLLVVFRYRQRHGMVFGLMLLLYPPTRIIIESIRVDNPHDVGGLTISQAVSLALMATGALYLLVIYKAMPLRSVRAVPVDPHVLQSR